MQDNVEFPRTSVVVYHNDQSRFIGIRLVIDKKPVNTAS